MRIKLPGRVLRNLVKAGVSVIKLNDDRQILRNLLLVATEDGLEITATDTLVGLWLKIPVSDTLKIEKTGRAVVNAQNLQRLVDTVANKDVTLVGGSRNFQVRAKGSRFKMVIEDVNDFPKIARFSLRKPYITLSADLVTKMIARTAFCAHDEASFQLMHGLLVRAAENELRMVATNGQRLAITTLPFSQQSKPEPFECELVIPADLAVTVKRIIGTDTETVDIQWMASFLNFRTTRGEVSVRALAGSYPIYGRGVPNNLEKITLDRKILIEILKQTTAFKSPTTNFVALQLQNDRMVFHSQVDGAGESEVEFEFEFEGDPRGLTINPDFMLQSLAAMRGEDVDLEIGNEMTPTILRERGDEMKNFCVYAVVRQ